MGERDLFERECNSLCEESHSFHFLSDLKIIHLEAEANSLTDVVKVRKKEQELKKMTPATIKIALLELKIPLHFRLTNF